MNKPDCEHCGASSLHLEHLAVDPPHRQRFYVCNCCTKVTIVVDQDGDHGRGGSAATPKR